MRGPGAGLACSAAAAAGAVLPGSARRAAPCCLPALQFSFLQSTVDNKYVVRFPSNDLTSVVTGGNNTSSGGWPWAGRGSEGAGGAGCDAGCRPQPCCSPAACAAPGAPPGNGAPPGSGSMAVLCTLPCAATPALLQASTSRRWACRRASSHPTCWPPPPTSWCGREGAAALDPSAAAGVLLLAWCR